MNLIEDSLVSFDGSNFFDSNPDERPAIPVPPMLFAVVQFKFVLKHVHSHIVEVMLLPVLNGIDNKLKRLF